MGYRAGEALVLAQVQAVTGFGASNTSRGRYQILNTGLAAVYAILRKGEWRMDWIGTGRARFTWTTIVEVWQRWRDDGTTLTDLEANVDTLITRFLQYRKLGDTTDAVNDSDPRRGGEPVEKWRAGGNGPAWLMADIVVEWTEEQAVTFEE